MNTCWCFNVVNLDTLLAMDMYKYLYIYACINIFAQMTSLVILNDFYFSRDWNHQPINIYTYIIHIYMYIYIYTYIDIYIYTYIYILQELDEYLQGGEHNTWRKLKFHVQGHGWIGSHWLNERQPCGPCHELGLGRWVSSKHWPCSRFNRLKRSLNR